MANRAIVPLPVHKYLRPIPAKKAEDNATKPASVSLISSPTSCFRIDLSADSLMELSACRHRARGVPAPDADRSLL